MNKINKAECMIICYSLSQSSRIISVFLPSILLLLDVKKIPVFLLQSFSHLVALFPLHSFQLIFSLLLFINTLGCNQIYLQLSLPPLCSHKLLSHLILDTKGRIQQVWKSSGQILADKELKGSVLHRQENESEL